VPLHAVTQAEQAKLYLIFFLLVLLVHSSYVINEPVSLLAVLASILFLLPQWTAVSD